MTRTVQNRIIKASNGLEMHLPGTNEKVSISDPKKLVTYFKNRFPRWKKNELVQVPELQIQFAVTLAQKEKDKEKPIAVQGASDAAVEIASKTEKHFLELYRFVEAFFYELLSKEKVNDKEENKRN